MYEIVNARARFQADVTGDGELDIRDATLIQMFVARLIDVFPADPVKTAGVKTLASVTENTSSASLNDTLTLIKTDLDGLYTYSSYDQYMALKKAYLEYKGATLSSSEQTKAVADLLAKQAELYDITGGAPTEEITVYYTDTKNWSSVKAYLWGTSGTLKAWPGSTMTYVKTNSNGYKIYSIKFSYEDYQSIIFTNGSSQTVDIALSGDNNVLYTINGESGGKFTCKTEKYS